MGDEQDGRVAGSGEAMRGLRATTGALVSRRALLHWLAGGAVGATAGAWLGGTGQWALALTPPGKVPASGNRAAASGANIATSSRGGSAPQLTVQASTASRSGTQVFKSRPDLHPPTVTIDISQVATAAPGLVLTDSSAGPSQQGALIIDGRGELVWFFPVPAAHNVRVQSYRGEPVLTWFQGTIVSGHGEGYYELYDSTYQEVAQVHATGAYRGDLHEFLLTEPGSALFTCYGQATADRSTVGGASVAAYYYGVVQEVDVATGRLLFEWRSDEHVSFDESYVPRPTSPIVPWDYFHINSVAVDPIDGNLIISARNTWAAYKLDRGSGEVLWRLGGKRSDFTMGPAARFAFQHDVRRHPDGTLTLFDDEAGPPDEAPQSRGLVLGLDEKARTAPVLDQYHHSPALLSRALGNMQDLGQGHRFVGWGISSYFTEYDSSGRAVFDGHLVAGTSSYRAFKQPWEGRPAAGGPAIAVDTGQGTATVYASWNGATEVEKWSVLGGAEAQGLLVLGVGRRAGFETAITVPDPPAYLAVVALDNTGAVLGRSSVLPSS
jgi:hypothetical protein